MELTQSWIRVELPGILHFRFMEKVQEDFGTSRAQNEALTMLIKKVINGQELYDIPIQTSKGYRVLSQSLPSNLKNKTCLYFYKKFGSFNSLSLGIRLVLQNYVDGKIKIHD